MATSLSDVADLQQGGFQASWFAPPTGGAPPSAQTPNLPQAAEEPQPQAGLLAPGEDTGSPATAAGQRLASTPAAADTGLRPSPLPAPGGLGGSQVVAPPPAGDGAATPAPADRVRLLVQWDPGATEAERTASLLAVGGSREELIHTPAMTARGEGVLEVIELGAGANPQAVLAAYRQTAKVISAEVDRFLQPQQVSNDPYYTRGFLWGMYGSDGAVDVGPGGTTSPYGSQAEGAWNQGFTGSRSVVVGIVDTGFDFNHPDLAANSWVNPYEIDDGIDNDGNGYIDDLRGWDFYNADNSIFDGRADLHGTHVAGTIGAVGGNGIGVAGVSWNVSLISTKFLERGGGYLSGAIQALDYLTDLKLRHGINIVASNNSWVSSEFSPALQDAIDRAAKANILFIAAAGNASLDIDAEPNYPSAVNTQAAAGYDAVVTVTSITDSGDLSSFANYGSNSVDLAAPGTGIYSTTPNAYYNSSSGTSMAAAHVTGAVALYAAAHPDTSPSQIRAALLASTTPTPSLAGLTVTGGRLNVTDFLAMGPEPSLAISAAQAFAVEGQSGVTTFTFQISRRGGVTGVTTVDWQVAGTGADPADGADFVHQVLPGGTVRFAPGETEKTITVEVQGDDLVERLEAFAVSLSNPSAGATLASDSVRSWILNDDGVISAFNSAAIVIPSEGSGQPSPSTVEVSGASDLTVGGLEVTLYNFSHSKPGDVDILLVGPSGASTLLLSDVGGSNAVAGVTLTFTARAGAPLLDGGPLSTGTFLPTDVESGDGFGDGAPAGPCSADLSVFNGTQATGAWRLFVQDDAPGGGGAFGGWSLSITPQMEKPLVSLSLASGAVEEDGLSNLEYTFTRTGSKASSLTVTYSLAGSATPGKDYSGLAGAPGSGSVTFAAGSATATVIVTPTADTEVEADESVALTLEEGTGYRLGTTGAVVGRILNDDYHTIEAVGNTKLLKDGEGKLFAQLGSAAPVAIKSAGVQVLEGGLGNRQHLAAETVAGVNQLVWRDGGTNELGLWTLDSGWDWQASEGGWDLHSPEALRQEANFHQDLNGDAIIGALPLIQLSLSPGTVTEDGITNLEYIFTRTGSTANGLTVNYSVAGTATPGTDYSGLEATAGIRSVSFAAGSATATVTLNPTVDTELEADETVALSLEAGRGYMPGTTNAVVGTILDDDYHTIEATGNTKLLKGFSNRVYAQKGNGAPIALKDPNRQPLQATFSSWELLGAETVAGVNQVVWKNRTGTRLSLWTMDASWDWQSSLMELSMGASRAFTQENNFMQDLNGDGFVGVPRPL